jgi:hypothetical protein
MEFIKRYVPMFLLLAFSGNPLFTDMPYSKVLLSVFAVVFFVYAHLNGMAILRFNHLGRLVGIMAFFLFLSLCHLIAFDFVSWEGVLGFLLKLVIAYSALHYYHSRKESFEVIYVKTMATLSLLSLPFFILNFFNHVGVQLEKEILKSMVFYTSVNTTAENVRNSGMFWEPGAFAGYSILAFLFIVSINGRFQIGALKKELLWLILGVITSFSTTGYVALGLIIIAYILTNYSYGKLILVPLFGFLALYTFNTFDFLQSKIIIQWDAALEMDRLDVSNTRFGALKMDFEYIQSSAWYGNGLHYSTRYRFHPWVTEDIGHGNGMSNFIAFWGIPLFIFWLREVYRIFKRRISYKFLSLICVLILLLVLQGEQFLNYPLFLIFFIFTTYPVFITGNESSLDRR